MNSNFYWRNVNNELPEYNKLVLVQYKDAEYNGQKFHVDSRHEGYDEGYWFNIGKFVHESDSPIIAWMPLPEEYVEY